jgi:hypothetical protein
LDRTGGLQLFILTILIYANRLGSFSEVALVLFLLSCQIQIQTQDFGIALEVFRRVACILGLIVANLMSTGLGFLKPERVTVSIGIFSPKRACDIGGFGDVRWMTRLKPSPFPLYGLVEASFSCSILRGAWKAAWTKAPPT